MTDENIFDELRFGVVDVIKEAFGELRYIIAKKNKQKIRQLSFLCIFIWHGTKFNSYGIQIYIGCTREKYTTRAKKINKCCHGRCALNYKMNFVDSNCSVYNSNYTYFFFVAFREKKTKKQRREKNVICTILLLKCAEVLVRVSVQQIYNKWLKAKQTKQHTKKSILKVQTIRIELM